MEVANQHVAAVIDEYIADFSRHNTVFRVIQRVLDDSGIGLRPVLDHLSIRTNDVSERAMEFEALGFSYDSRIGVLERDSWWAKVYRRPGFPAIYVDQAFEDRRGDESTIRGWVNQFSDAHLHHVAIQVNEIERAIERLGPLGVRFSANISGDVGSEFRQIYTEPEIVDGVPFTVVELVERRWGYTGFLSPEANT